ncbi:MAG: putative beta-lysine N-acetyltransferase [Desulfotomaculaceae bacterium]|nr:putative beta-lysine N-acetyltransferase [Desulfotomaculaceae bacterium]
MAVSMKIPAQPGQDRQAEITGRDFNCHILVSPFNRRITVNRFNLTRPDGAAEMAQVLTEKARAQGLDKIWLKSSARWVSAFLDSSMKLEATIPGYYQGEDPTLVFARYLSASRQTPSNSSSIELAEKLISGLKTETSKRILPAGITLKWAQREHCADLARLFSRVFPTYPFPVDDPDYIEYTLDKGVCYISAWHNGELVAASSAETNWPQKNAEMTDFATLPRWRGHGLANCLLARMESRLQDEGYRCLYTIARSSSIGMNKVFAGAGYGFNGVLINNCNISGDFEDMNVWSKIL